MNVNSCKVKEFVSKEEFDQYWSFEIFDNLADKDNREQIEEGVKKYFYNIDNNIKFRDASVLKRIVEMNVKEITPDIRCRLISGFYQPEFLAQLELWHFKRIREKVNNDGEFFSLLDNQIDKVLFNSYHYQLLSFYSKYRKDYDLTNLKKRIDQLRMR